MARKTNTKRNSSSPKRAQSRKVSTLLSRFQNKYVFVFVLLFAVVGVYALLQANANPKLSDNPKDVVFAYYASRPTTMTREAAGGDINYESYSASYMVLADGSLVCDDGNATGTVSTGKIGLGQVKQLEKETRDLDLDTLPNTITGDITAPQVSNHEGYMATVDGEILAFTVHKDGNKPDKLAQLQQKILRACERANKTDKRNENSFKVPGRSVTVNESLLDKLAQVLVPKVSACCAPVQHNPGLANDQAARTNQRRAALGIRQLQRRGCMDEAANYHAKRMAEQDNLHHNPERNNELIWFCHKEGMNHNNWTLIGENVGMSPNGNSAELFKAYVNSPSHRSNLDNRSARYMGHGAYKNMNNGKTYHTYLIATW